MSAAPLPLEVLAARNRLQAEREIGITAAQIACAEMLHTSKRAWQQWETGIRRMHPAFWELFQIKAMGGGQARPQRKQPLRTGK